MVVNSKKRKSIAINKAMFVGAEGRFTKEELTDFLHQINEVRV
jgi:hypothetical protein